MAITELEASPVGIAWDSLTNHQQEQVEKALPLLRWLAAKYSRGLLISASEAFSSGYTGLVEAAVRFDPSRGATFATYATPRIRGAILDDLRDADWVPRSVRAKARAVESAVHALEKQLGRAPTSKELAEELDISEEHLRKTLAEVHGAVVVQLDQLLTLHENSRGDGVLTMGDTIANQEPTVLELICKGDERRDVRNTIKRLPERERYVIEHYYLKGRFLHEIAGDLHVTESRICQIHKQALQTLRRQLRQAQVHAPSRANAPVITQVPRPAYMVPRPAPVPAFEDRFLELIRSQGGVFECEHPIKVLALRFGLSKSGVSGVITELLHRGVIARSWSKRGCYWRTFRLLEHEVAGDRSKPKLIGGPPIKTVKDDDLIG